MKTIIIAVIFSLVFVGFSFAAEDEKSPTVTFSTKVFSKYVGEAGGLWSDKPVLQSDLTVNVGKGFYFGVWHSMSLSNPGTSTDCGNENDPYIGWSGDAFGLNVDLMMTYFDIVPVFNYPDGDSLEVSVKVGKMFDVSDKHSLTPYVNVKYGFPVHDTGEEGLDGTYIYLGLVHNWAVTDKFSVTQKGVLVIDTGAYGGDSGLLGSYELKGSYAFTKWVSLEVSGKAIGPLSKINDGRKAHLIGSAGLVFSF
jgi:hypothetical protein